MPHPKAGTTEWLSQVEETIIAPELPIIDPHHHLWRRPGGDYLLEDLWLDTESGHRIKKTVFVECHAEYRKDGPIHMQPVGETEFIARIAEQSAVSGGAEIKAIQANADVSLGAAVEEVLVAHEHAGRGGTPRRNSICCRRG